jgi:signal transduction histidine kinase
MERTEAQEAIFSDSISARLKAARYFSRNAIPADQPMLRTALVVETVPWIRRALERATEATENVHHASPSTSVDIGENARDEQLARDLRAEAVEEVAGTILHEFSALIGMIRLTARAEIPNYPASKMHKRLDQLNALVRAVRNLKRAASVATFSNFDLVEVIHEALETARGVTENFTYHLAGPRPFIVTADRGSMAIAITNGVTNAIEAMVDNEKPAVLTINWGRGGDENWLVLMDNGPGFVGDPSTALKLGVTNKKDHIGYGLATAQHAMRAMEGDVFLSNNDEGGAKFELRWYRDYENING